MLQRVCIFKDFSVCLSWVVRVLGFSGYKRKKNTREGGQQEELTIKRRVQTFSGTGTSEDFVFCFVFLFLGQKVRADELCRRSCQSPRILEYEEARRYYTLKFHPPHDFRGICGSLIWRFDMFFVFVFALVLFFPTCLKTSVVKSCISMNVTLTKKRKTLKISWSRASCRPKCIYLNL